MLPCYVLLDLETAGALGVRLLQARLVKEKQPVYNHRPRRECALSDRPLARDLLRCPLTLLPTGCCSNTWRWLARAASS